MFEGKNDLKLLEIKVHGMLLNRDILKLMFDFPRRAHPEDWGSLSAFLMSSPFTSS